MYHWMYFLHAINSDRQTRLLNVLGQIAMIRGDKKKFPSESGDQHEPLTARLHRVPVGLRTRRTSLSMIKS